MVNDAKPLDVAYFSYFFILLRQLQLAMFEFAGWSKYKMMQTLMCIGL